MDKLGELVEEGAKDTDSDGVPDAFPDNCIDVKNRSQEDTNGDGVGDACEAQLALKDCETKLAAIDPTVGADVLSDTTIISDEGEGGSQADASGAYEGSGAFGCSLILP